jgi:hypothetical protein
VNCTSSRPTCEREGFFNWARWVADLGDLLAGKAATPPREQLTLIRVFEELRGRGYDGLPIAEGSCSTNALSGYLPA